MPFSQYCSRLSAQLAQSRHESTRQPTAARSPALNFLTPLPTDTHAADDLVPGHDGIYRALPLVARDVQVGMAHAAEEDVDLDVGWPGRAALNSKRPKRSTGGLGGISGCGNH